MDDRWLSVVLAVGLCIIFVTLYLGFRYRGRAARQEDDARRAAELDQMVQAGLRTPEGSAACMVCGLAATEYMPISGTSWMDHLPMLNRLFSLPPRYTIVDNLAGDVCLCRSHKAVAVRKLEQFHAGLRAERARFNAQHEERVAAMDGGQLLRAVMEQHGFQLKVLRQPAATPLPQLDAPAVRYDEQIATAVVSGSGASLPPEEE